MSSQMEFAIMQAILRAKNSEKLPKKCFPRPVPEPVQQEAPSRSLILSNCRQSSHGQRPTQGRAPSCPQGVANSRMKEFCGIHCPPMKDFTPRATRQLMPEGCNCNWSLQTFTQRNALLPSSGWKSKQCTRLAASHSCILKMEATDLTETFLMIYDNTQRHNLLP